MVQLWILEKFPRKVIPQENYLSEDCPPDEYSENVIDDVEFALLEDQKIYFFRRFKRFGLETFGDTKCLTDFQ